MGAEFVCGSVPKEQTNNIVETMNQLIEDARYDHGHAGYTGTLAEANGVNVLNKEFPHFNAAYDWLLDNAEKWGPVVVVTSENYYVYGAWCSS